MVVAANATTTRIGAHLGRRELMLGFISNTWEASEIKPQSQTRGGGEFGSDGIVLAFGALVGPALREEI